MVAVLACATASEPAERALDRMRAVGLPAIPVRDAAGRLAGMLYEGAKHSARFEPLDRSQTLDAALRLFGRQQADWLPVVEDGKPVGIAGMGEVAAHLAIDRELGPLVLGVSTELSANDEMLGLDGSWTSYLMIATDALRCIRRSMRLAGKRDVRSIFDLACGHGRVLRVLKAAFPQAKLTACDINVDGVEFCARALGAVPVVSHVRAREIDVTGPFDLVWSGSLFNHFDAARWDEFLDLVEAVLEPGGLLVLAIHSQQLADGMRLGIPDPKLSGEGIELILRGYDESGFGYADYTGERDWGDNVAKPEWVKALIASRAGLELVDYEESGWSSALDVVTCIRRQQARGLLGRRRSDANESV
jgi:SAM-dependent methyltransferase